MAEKNDNIFRLLQLMQNHATNGGNTVVGSATPTSACDGASGGGEAQQDSNTARASSTASAPRTGNVETRRNVSATPKLDAKPTATMGQPDLLAQLQQLQALQVHPGTGEVAGSGSAAGLQVALQTDPQLITGLSQKQNQAELLAALAKQHHAPSQQSASNSTLQPKPATSTLMSPGDLLVLQLLGQTTQAQPQTDAKPPAKQQQQRIRMPHEMVLSALATPPQSQSKTSHATAQSETKTQTDATMEPMALSPLDSKPATTQGKPLSQLQNFQKAQVILEKLNYHQTRNTPAQPQKLPHDLILGMLGSTPANLNTNASTNILHTQTQTPTKTQTSSILPAGLNQRLQGEEEKLKLILLLANSQQQQQNNPTTAANPPLTQPQQVLTQALQEIQMSQIKQLLPGQTNTNTNANLAINLDAKPAAVNPNLLPNAATCSTSTTTESAPTHTAELAAVCEQLGISLPPAASASASSHVNTKATTSNKLEVLLLQHAASLAALQPKEPPDESLDATTPANASTNAGTTVAAAASTAVPLHLEERALYPSPQENVKRGRAVKFPKTLHSILLKLEQDGRGIAGFSPDGMAFVVRKPEEFAKEVLPEHFKMSNFSSFQRQINLYDFQRVKGELNISYRHPLFQRDKPDLCVTMRRTKRKNRQGRPSPDP